MDTRPTNQRFISAGVLVSTVLILFLGIFLFKSTQTKSEDQKKLDEALTQATSLGLYTKTDQLRKPIPDEENAYLTMADALKYPVKSELLIFYLQGKATKAEAAQVIADSKSQAAVIARASTLPKWQVNRNYETNIQSVELEELSQVKRWVKFFAARAQIAMRNNEYEIAIQNLKSSARLTNKLQYEPFFIGLLAHCSCLKVINSTLAEITVEERGSDLALSINEIIQKTLLKPNLEYALQSESAFTVDITARINELSTEEWEGLDNETIGELNTRQLTARSLEKLVFAKESIKATPLNLPKSADNFENYNSRPQTKISQEERISRQLFTPLGEVFRAVEYSKTWSSLLEIGSKILRYQKVNRKFPASLKQIGLESKIDTWSNQPYVYENHKTGFILRSAGADRKFEPVKSLSADDAIFQTLDRKKAVLLGK